MSDLAILEDVFDAALTKPPADRDAFLDAACASDPPLRRQVEKLLAAHDDARSFLESPAVVLRNQLSARANLAAESHSTQVGPYKLLQQIGEGGMGVIYMAQQLEPVERLVALKIVKPGMDSRQVIARFEAERQALAMMDHPNIARVLDAGMVSSRQTPSAVEQEYGTRSVPTVEGRPYFVMELVKGIPITKYCDEHNLGLRERLQLFITVCEAIQHAHQKGIIHRDLKPSNVLVAEYDDRPIAKVIDFGIAKAMSQRLTEKTFFTEFGQIIGTIEYMSPEQAKLNQLDVDTRSDVYSLGVLLYELLTGTTPFDKQKLSGAPLDEMLRIIREEEPETVSARIERTSTNSPRVDAGVNRRVHAAISELDWIAMKALDKDRTRRYDTASNLAADLRRYLADEPVQACPPSAIYRFHKFVRKHRAWLTTALFVAASLLVGTGVSVWQAVRATAAEAQSTANEAKAKTEGQKANAIAQAEATQRKQAEKNLEVALEAVDRMLANVSDPELVDVPRVGPLRRKMLRDAIAFYQRIPLWPGESSEVRFRVAKTWNRIASISENLNEYEHALTASRTAITALTQLHQEHPSHAKYQEALAQSQMQAGWYFYTNGQDRNEAETLYRDSSELFAELARNDPKQKSWLNGQARALRSLAMVLESRGKQDESADCLARSLDLLERSEVDSSLDRSALLHRMASLRSKIDSGESDELYRRAIVEHRKHFAEHKSAFEIHVFSHLLYLAANSISMRHPEEAETLLDEAIALRRENVRNSSRTRKLAELTWPLRDNARLLRRLAAIHPTDERTANRLTKAEALFQEAIRTHREHVSQYARDESRYQLVELLQEESEYLLGQCATIANGASTCALQADALLTEAIQLCHALVAAFPENNDYKNRLAVLLNLQEQNFGKNNETKSGRANPTTAGLQFPQP